VRLQARRAVARVFGRACGRGSRPIAFTPAIENVAMC